MISVVIPLKNSESTIKECLNAVFSNTFRDFEVIVVDDGSTDNSMAKVSHFDCRVVKNAGPAGVSNARNTGAGQASGEIILFIDADIVIDNDALHKINTWFMEDAAEAVVGILKEKERYGNFFSQYKNLWMRYTFKLLPRNISLLYTSIAAIRKNVFAELGGFNANYRVPNVEDNELGRRMTEAGHRILLDKSIEVEHIKRYTFFSLLKTHYNRTTGLVKMIIRNRILGFTKGNYTSVPTKFILNIPLSSGLVLFIFLWGIIGHPWAPAGVLFFSLSIVLNNLGWLGYLRKVRGFVFSLKAAFFLFFELMTLTLFMGAGLIEYAAGRKY